MSVSTRGVLAGATVLTAFVLSLLWWRADAGTCLCEYCPDLYCHFADKLLNVLTRWDRASLHELGQFTQIYNHAHSPLGPLVHAFLALVVPRPIVAYMLLSGLATAVAWAVVTAVARRAWSLSPSLVPLLCAAFFSHILVIRAFARPLTDAVGMACVIGTLWALGRYVETRTTGASLLLFGVQLLGLFSRVSYIPMLGMPALAQLWGADRLTTRLRRALLSGLVHGAGPGLVFLGLNWALGTLHLDDAWKFAHRPEFTNSYTLSDFLTSTAMALNGYGILLVAFVTRASMAHPTFRLHLAWLGLYLAFLGLGGGALWPRYFLPIVPSLFVLTAPILESLHRSHPWNVRALVALLVSANILYLHPVTRDLRLPARLLVNDLRGLSIEDGALTTARAAPASGTWELTTNQASHEISRATDGHLDTGWRTTTSQAPGIYVQLDLGSVHGVAGLALRGWLAEYPRRYTIETSVEGATWTRVATGKGVDGLVGFLDELPRVVVRLDGSAARYLRVTQVGHDRAHWSINELDLYLQARRLAGP